MRLKYLHVFDERNLIFCPMVNVGILIICYKMSVNLYAELVQLMDHINVALLS